MILESSLFPVICLADAKQQTVSHSTIEKQRRDRINSLIDELRELVPSAATMKGPDGADMKRPKHVVLSDTISLLKSLQHKARAVFLGCVGSCTRRGGVLEWTSMQEVLAVLRQKVTVCAVVFPGLLWGMSDWHIGVTWFSPVLQYSNRRSTVTASGCKLHLLVPHIQAS